MRAYLRKYATETKCDSFLISLTTFPLAKSRQMLIRASVFTLTLPYVHNTIYVVFYAIKHGFCLS